MPARRPLKKRNDTLKRVFYILSLVVIVATSLPSCGGDVVYDKYRPTPTEGWEKNDTLVFDVPRLRRHGTYSQEIGVRITRDFPFTRVSLLVERVIEPGHKVVADTLDCRLYDDEGNILGHGISHYQYRFALPGIEMREGDSLHVCIRHIMKREILPGISDIGFRMSLER